MLRQLLALLALVAGLTAVPAAAEVRLSAQSGQVELAFTEASTVRSGVSAGILSRKSFPVSQVEVILDAGIDQACGLYGPVRIGIDRAHE
jgi:uncharacterized membrane protein